MVMALYHIYRAGCFLIFHKQIGISSYIYYQASHSLVIQGIPWYPTSWFFTTFCVDQVMWDSWAFQRRSPGKGGENPWKTMARDAIFSDSITWNDDVVHLSYSSWVWWFVSFVSESTMYFQGILPSGNKKRVFLPLCLLLAKADWVSSHTSLVAIANWLPWNNKGTTKSTAGWWFGCHFLFSH